MSAGRRELFGSWLILAHSVALQQQCNARILARRQGDRVRLFTRNG